MPDEESNQDALKARDIHEADVGAAASWPEMLNRVRARTPARLLVGRAGASYRTATQLELREAHAAARDAVRTELDTSRDLGADFVRTWKLFEVQTEAASKDEYLVRPDLGRKLRASASTEILQRCCERPVLQVVIGDGLSVTAIAQQAPRLLPLLSACAQQLEARGASEMNMPTR